MLWVHFDFFCELLEIGIKQISSTEAFDTKKKNEGQKPYETVP